jgi:hypothetical protein
MISRLVLKQFPKNQKNKSEQKKEQTSFVKQIA